MRVTFSAPADVIPGAEFPSDFLFILYLCISLFPLRLTGSFCFTLQNFLMPVCLASIFSFVSLLFQILSEGFMLSFRFRRDGGRT